MKVGAEDAEEEGSGAGDRGARRGAGPPPAGQPGTGPPGGAHEVVELGSSGTTTADVVAVARRGAQVRLGPDARRAMAAARAVVERLAASAEPHYGVSTGFGALAVRHIAPEAREHLQESLVRSHAAGMGPPVEPEVVRALVFLRTKTLCSGRTGARPVLAETFAAMLNAGITPVVPEHGSLGCSGDLAPLAHCALVLMGEGEAFVEGGARVGGARARSGGWARPH